MNTDNSCCIEVQALRENIIMLIQKVSILDEKMCCIENRWKDMKMELDKQHEVVERIVTSTEVLTNNLQKMYTDKIHTIYYLIGIATLMATIFTIPNIFDH